MTTPNTPHGSPGAAVCVEIDARGLRCPLPVLKMEAALRRMAPGERLLIRADDPIAAVDIPHFCASGGHGVERLAATAGLCVFLVTAGANKAPPGRPGAAS